MKKQNKKKTDEEFLNEEFDFSQAIKKTGNKEVKVKKTIRFDADVLLWLTEEGERRGLAYQTLANSLLREAMTKKSDLEMRIERIEQTLLKKSS